MKFRKQARTPPPGQQFLRALAQGRDEPAPRIPLPRAGPAWRGAYWRPSGGRRRPRRRLSRFVPRRRTGSPPRATPSGASVRPVSPPSGSWAICSPPHRSRSRNRSRRLHPSRPQMPSGPPSPGKRQHGPSAVSPHGQFALLPSRALTTARAHGRRPGWGPTGRSSFRSLRTPIGDPRHASVTVVTERLRVRRVGRTLGNGGIAAAAAVSTMQGTERWPTNRPQNFQLSARPL